MEFKKIGTKNANDMNLLFGGDRVSNWHVDIYEIDGKQYGYIGGMGWAWDLESGKSTYLRWNIRRANQIGLDAELAFQFEKAIKSNRWA